MKQFVIVFDRRQGTILKSLEFSEARREAALQRRFALEREYRDQPDVEVVALGAASMEDLKRTHTRYFKGELRKRARSLG